MSGLSLGFYFKFDTRVPSLGTRVSNLKSVALTVLELLAYNAQQFRGSRDRGHAPFSENFWGSRPDSPCEQVCEI